MIESLERTRRHDRERMHLRALITADKRSSRWIMGLCLGMALAMLGMLFIRRQAWREVYGIAVAATWLLGHWLHWCWWQGVLRAHDYGRTDFKDLHETNREESG